MGYWSLATGKTNSKREDVDLNMDDLGHIAELVQQGFTSGEIIDEDDGEEEEEESK